MHGQPLQPIPRTGWMKTATKLSVEPVDHRYNMARVYTPCRSRQPLPMLGAHLSSAFSAALVDRSHLIVKQFFMVASVWLRSTGQTR
ncbi:hypothetical protein [Spirosoma fluminis]